jgi:hypothetical protein
MATSKKVNKAPSWDAYVLFDPTPGQWVGIYATRKAAKWLNGKGHTSRSLSAPPLLPLEPLLPLLPLDPLLPPELPPVGLGAVGPRHRRILVAHHGAQVKGTVMRIYVASSWRNEARQQETVRTLRAAGHIVYDFRNPAPGDTGFGWSQCAPVGTDAGAFRDMMQDPAFFRDEVLTHPKALSGYGLDMHGLRTAEATVLVLPCGRSAHLELGYAVGARQRTLVLLDDPMSEPELMYLMCSDICVSLDEVVSKLGGQAGAGGDSLAKLRSKYPAGRSSDSMVRAVRETAKRAAAGANFKSGEELRIKPAVARGVGDNSPPEGE